MGSDEATGDAEDLEHATYLIMQADKTFDGQERVMSRAAYDLQVRATSHSAFCGHPGYVPDDYVSGLSTETTITAAELCAVGLWERVEGGYRVIDWEAVEICLDHVREPGGEDPQAHAWEQEREAQVRSVAFSIFQNVCDVGG